MQRPGTPILSPRTGLGVMSRQHQLHKKEKSPQTSKLNNVKETTIKHEEGKKKKERKIKHTFIYSQLSITALTFDMSLKLCLRISLKYQERFHIINNVLCRKKKKIDYTVKATLCFCVPRNFKTLRLQTKSHCYVKQSKIHNKFVRFTL